MSHPLELELKRRILQDTYSTAYPWNPEDWSQFSRQGRLRFDKYGKLSFYVHIPFCKSICRFCEYTLCLVPDEALQRRYLETVHRDILRFLDEYPHITLEGFDIGGGTPTSLSDDNFAYLMRIYSDTIHRVKTTDDFEPSIEASVITISPEKAGMIRDAGIRRISVGIQSLSFRKNKREIGWGYPDAKEIIDSVNIIRTAGDFKLNLDFMYGFRFQDDGSFEDLDRIAIESIKPDQVTLYELRTIRLKDFEGGCRNNCAAYYDKWCDTLMELGYHGNYGGNAFSIQADDSGVSSYIRHRMLEGADYKGFGISAQSMSEGNVEYNRGKNSSDLKSLINNMGNTHAGSFEPDEYYDLPVNEKFAKFVCISSYSGGFDWRVACERFYPDFFERFRTVLDYLTARNGCRDDAKVEISGDRINITRKGFEHYGPIFSLFYKS